MSENMIITKVAEAYYVTTSDNVRMIEVHSLNIDDESVWGSEVGGETIDVILDPAVDIDIEQRCKLVGSAAVISYSECHPRTYMKVDEGEFAEYTNGSLYLLAPVCIKNISKRHNRISISCELLKRNCK